MSRTSAVLMAPLFSFLVACVSPGASECDLNPPVLRGVLFYASNVAAVTSICSWQHHWGHPCGSIAVLPGLFSCLAYACVPILGARRATYYWPAYRVALSLTGALQIARVAAQVYAVPIAQAAVALGIPGLLPMSVAVQCQAQTAHTHILIHAELSGYAAVGLGCASLLRALVLTPSLRAWLSGSCALGLHVARVLELKDGLLLVRQLTRDERQHLDATSDSSSSSSGLFGGAKSSSLWSDWSAEWSDADETIQAKLSRKLSGRLPKTPREFVQMKRLLAEARQRLAAEEAQKARRRATSHGKAYGKLVWKLLRRAQRCPENQLSIVPRDALRIIVATVVEDETGRLEELYASRVAAGALYRG